MRDTTKARRQGTKRNDRMPYKATMDTLNPPGTTKPALQTFKYKPGYRNPALQNLKNLPRQFNSEKM